MTLEYLQAINDSYKEKYLVDAADYSELLVYKWNKPVEDIEDMVVDIERLKMDDWDMEQTKFKDWNFYWNSHWNDVRYNYTEGKLEMMGDFVLTSIWDVDSLQFDLNDGEHRERVYESFVSLISILFYFFLFTNSFVTRFQTTASTLATILITLALSSRSSVGEITGSRITFTFERPSTKQGQASGFFYLRKQSCCNYYSILPVKI